MVQTAQNHDMTPSDLEHLTNVRRRMPVIVISPTLGPSVPAEYRLAEKFMVHAWRADPTAFAGESVSRIYGALCATHPNAFHPLILGAAIACVLEALHNGDYLI